MKVKRVVTMRDGGGYASPQRSSAAFEVAQGTEISPGQDQVSVMVVAQYELTR